MRTSQQSLTEWVYSYLIHRGAGMDYRASDGSLYQRDGGMLIPGINAPVGC